MNNLFYLIIFISLSYTTQAQDTSYFPHAVGDTWVYVYDDGRIEKQVITSDSADQLGNRFLCINNESRYSYKWLYMITGSNDSVFFLPTGINKLRYRFPITGKNDKWMVSPGRDIATVYDTYPASVLGKLTNAIDIRYYMFRVENGDTIMDSRTWERNQIIAKGFGLVWEGTEVEYMVLAGCIINGDTLGYIPTTGLTDEKSVVPEGFKLYQNYPNPFNPVTQITYSIRTNSLVKLHVYDILGNRIAELVNEIKPAGKYKVAFNGSNLPSGIYIYKLQCGSYIETKKMTLIR